eukprot:CAMPEP_0201681010 /NCGR_PEP_ID=MMETSP0494-20130426/50892_1 /ASSEMBLY_ACC=CAM_ASM_000839 /TAXON_ID=420259 /ORGANISM="Thalassiosira gravida, Strain GMp14c1" /LENGTH=516 /DNA_ID=CAMNT_0048164741 /DNA_START=401 /DNA_END=1952 /DNA_ORIENTATION=+
MALPNNNPLPKGLARLKTDFLNSLHIQQATLTQLHLQRKIQRSKERRKQKLRSREVHGIHVVNEEGREIAFLSSDVYTLPKKRTRRYDNQSSEESESTIHRQHEHDGAKKSSSSPIIVQRTQHYLSTRRPQEHQRQISRDLRTTLPTVFAFLFIPGVGYAFLLLGMMFPRLLLSRQFHTNKQRWEFAEDEFGNKRCGGWEVRLNGDFWGMMMRCMPRLKLVCGDEADSNGECGDDGEERGNANNDNSDDGIKEIIPGYLEPLSYHKMDAAGPVYTKQSMLQLYSLFQHLNNQQQQQQQQHHNNATATTSSKRSPSIQNLQTTHLHSLALSNNLASPIYLPSTIAPLFLQTFVPNVYLQRKLTTLAENIVMDDAALIEEGQLECHCCRMTEEEVLDACWLRGLPLGRFVTVGGTTTAADDRGGGGGTGGNRGNGVDDSQITIMRNVLTNHLQMMKAVMTMKDSSLPVHRSSSIAGMETTTGDLLRPKGDLVRDATLQLLILHLPAVRYSMMIHSKKC